MSGFDELLCHRITVRYMVEPPDDDRYGNKAPLVHDEDLDETIDARVEQPDASEDVRDRELQRERYLVFMRAPARPLTGVDELYWHDEDVTLKLEGGPLKTYDATELHHLEVQAFRLTG